MDQNLDEKPSKIFTEPLFIILIIIVIILNLPLLYYLIDFFHSHVKEVKIKIMFVVNMFRK